MACGIGVTAVILALSAILAFPVVQFIKLWIIINKFEGPTAIPLIGNALQFKQDAREFMLQVYNWIEEYRLKTGGIMRFWLGPVPVIFVFKATMVEVILSSSRHIKKGFVYTFLEPWLGLGLLTSTGQKWYHRRKVLTPTFHFSILHNFLDVFNEQSAILCQKLEQFADKPDPINICPLITLGVLDMICETAMGKQLKAQSNSNNEYVNAVSRMTDLIQKRQKKPWLWPNQIYTRTHAGREHTHCLKILHDMTNMIIAERKHEPPRCVNGEEDNATGRQKRIAFLDLLLQLHRDNPSFTLEDIREEVDTFMFEGHDTTAALTSWALFAIGHHTKVQKRLHDELDEVFGKSSRPATTDDLQKLHYLTCVVKETLRLFPPVPIIGRDLEEECMLDGKVVPKGTLIVLGISPLHRDPEQFPDPDVFDPDRFLQENSIKRHPYAFIPFSAGPRNCIGQKFALNEDKVLLSTILRRYSIESTQSLEETGPTGEIVLKPSNGILLKLTHRK